MVCWHGSGTLISLEGNRMAMRYIDILENQVHLVMLHFYAHDNGYFMDDNTIILCARSVKIDSLNASLTSNVFQFHRITQILYLHRKYNGHDGKTHLTALYSSI
ncbi:hypothetical protein TNCV_2671631 [Trichonephila clavipes]|nr:hypothetical protein TNCV_2671631 [Trichonephila clavipes]